MSDRICVLGAGEVQQIGTPGEVYEDPENRFVADFIGETNFLPAEVIGVEDGRATVRTPLGLVNTYQKGARVGASATLSLRPEKIGLDEQVPQGVERLRGVVSSRNYMGGYTHYSIAVNGVELRVSKRNAVSHSASLEPGRAVELGFRPDSARVLGQ